MATSKEVAERLLKLLIGKDVEDECLDDISTYYLCEGLTELVERARIGIEVVSAWEREKEGGEASPASKPETKPHGRIPRDNMGYGTDQTWYKARQQHDQV